MGVILVFAAGMLWSLNGALIKLVNESGHGPHGVTISFYRSLFAGLFLIPFARGRFASLLVGGREASGVSWWRKISNLRPEVLWCAVFFTLMTACFVVANTMTAAANAIILQYTSTFWVFGLSPWLLRERPARRDVGLLGIAVVGIAIIFFGNAATDLAALLIALAAGLFFGLLVMMIRRLRDVDPAALMVVNNLGAALLLAPLVWLVGEFSVDLRCGLLLVFMGVVQFGLPYYLFALGLRRIPAHRASLVSLIEPVLVPGWTYLAVGETIPASTIIGGLLIFGALVITLRVSKQSNEFV